MCPRRRTNPPRAIAGLATGAARVATTPRPAAADANGNPQPRTSVAAKTKRVELADARDQAGLGCGRADQFEDDLTRDQRFAAPILGDVAKQAMFDLVPLRCAGRIVMNMECQAGLVGELSG
jgi:hypothetical protein